MFLNIINASLTSGVFPSTWKLSTVVPVPKIAGTVDAENYRPINTLSTPEKVLEIVVKIQLESFVNNNNILIDNQSGYRGHHSCESSLNLVLAEWKKEINERKIIIALFIDFKRAFETIDIGRMLHKLEKYGICGAEKRWFESYLQNRSQQVKIESTLSSELFNMRGVPQGSILGALLFILYINDINKVLKHCQINLFADDTLLHISCSDINDGFNKINEDLKYFTNWLNVNKMKINEAKTKYLVINHNSEINCVIKVNNCEIKRVKSMKYLGVMIDDQLNFKCNNEYIHKKVSKKIGFLGRISKKLTFENKILTYNTIIQPHFQYCASIIFLSNEGDLKSLQRLQNRAMRLIIKCDYLTSSKWMLDFLNWLSVKQLITYWVLKFIFKIKYGLLPKYLNTNLKLVGDQHQHFLRNNSDFMLPGFYMARTQNSLFFNGCKIFNSMPSIIKEETNFNKFKKLCINFVKEKY